MFNHSMSQRSVIPSARWNRPCEASAVKLLRYGGAGGRHPRMHAWRPPGGFCFFSPRRKEASIANQEKRIDLSDFLVRFPTKDFVSAETTTGLGGHPLDSFTSPSNKQNFAESKPLACKKLQKSPLPSVENLWDNSFTYSQSICQNPTLIPQKRISTVSLPQTS